jgi:hypothetical protein
MTTIFTRSALVAWGGKPDSDVAYVVDGCKVTWSDVMHARRERQEQRLARIRRAGGLTSIWRIQVEYFDQWCFGGWQALADRIGRESIWIDRDRQGLVAPLMKAFPVALPFGSESERWALWKETFAREFRRGTHHRKPRGVGFVRWDGRHSLERVSSKSR